MNGITEAKSEKGEEYGLERLQETIDKITDQSPKDMLTGLMNDLYAFSGTEEINDDYTTMIVKFK